jgi:hypothetical protein
MIGTQEAYAKHRREHGLIGGTRGAVQKALKTGRISKNKEGLIDFAVANQSWKRNTNKLQQRLPKRTTSAEKQEAPGTDPEPEPPPPSEQDYGAESKPLSLVQAQLKHELAKASKTEFEVAKLRGILVDAEEAATEWQRQILAARKHALQLPGKLAPKVAVESDVLICQHLIEREIRAMLSELSEYRANA